MAATALRGPPSGDYLNCKTTEGNQAVRRQVFVQTETGCVLGIELDGSENVHTVKKKLQLSLNAPTEETSLTYGDTVLKNDLSTVRNHSPLLLTRNCLHRSSSTPCLSPSSNDLYQRDGDCPIEVIACLRVLILCTIFLKEAASFGLCLAQVGDMMSREFRGHAEELSKLELLCIEARSLLLKSEMMANTSSENEDEFQFDLEFEASNGDSSRILEETVSIHNSCEKSSKFGMNYLFNLKEAGEPKSKTSISGTSPGNRSANEQLPTSSSFVTLADMNEEEWKAFLENIQKLLYLEFESYKSGMLGPVGQTAKGLHRGSELHASFENLNRVCRKHEADFRIWKSKVKIRWAKGLHRGLGLHASFENPNRVCRKHEADCRIWRSKINFLYSLILGLFVDHGFLSFFQSLESSA